MSVLMKSSSLATMGRILGRLSSCLVGIYLFHWVEPVAEDTIVVGNKVGVIFNRLLPVD